MHHMKLHSPSYKRNHSSKKPRKPRKDKGSIRRNLARLLSGYDSDEDGDGSEDGDTDEIQVDSNCGDVSEEEGGSDSSKLDVSGDLQEEEEDERRVGKKVKNTPVTADECNNDSTHVISNRSLPCMKSMGGDCCDNNIIDGGHGSVGEVCNDKGVREGCNDSGYGGDDGELVKERMMMTTAFDKEGGDMDVM